MKRMLQVIITIVCLLTTGCVSVEISEDVESEYSRESVQQYVQSAGFGRGKLDDIYVALQYVYDDVDIAKKHGKEFELNSEQVICHNSEGQSFFLVGIYKGQAEYSVQVGESVYRVKLSKTYGEKWSVDNCVEEELS